MNLLIELLNRSPAERDIQDFLERRPIAVPGPDYLLGNAVISKLVLGSEFITDFAYINPTSGATYLRLVEIEAPGKPIFNKNDHLTSEFQQALQQTKDWLHWCGGTNEAYLHHLLSPLYRLGCYTPASLTARAMLVYGRQAEINSDKRKRRWEAEIRHNMTFITIRTFDGFARDRAMFLEPSYASEVKCVSYRDQDFRTKVND